VVWDGKERGRGEALFRYINLVFNFFLAPCRGKMKEGQREKRGGGRKGGADPWSISNYLKYMILSSSSAVSGSEGEFQKKGGPRAAHRCFVHLLSEGRGEGDKGRGRGKKKCNQQSVRYQYPVSDGRSNRPGKRRGEEDDADCERLP